MCRGYKITTSGLKSQPLPFLLETDPGQDILPIKIGCIDGDDQGDARISEEELRLMEEILSAIKDKSEGYFGGR